MTDLKSLSGLFYPQLADLGEFTAVTTDELPVAYQNLLVHDDHMTVTIEAFYGSLVSVRVLHEQTSEHTYARASVLLRQSDGRAVQFGIVRIDVSGLPELVRSEIMGGDVPLGRALIRHNVLRHVKLERVWRIKSGPTLREHLGAAASEAIYGRSARILVNRQPAVELLEIVKA